MNLDTIIEYIKNNKEVSLLELKEQFNLSESEIKVLKPFLVSLGASLLSVDDINSICEKCPLNISCLKISKNNVKCCN
ncbi:MAG TPA: hypothetical protein PLO45_06760 [Defluviitoga sp.]|nr:hypothetical protein [Defluviitoga sp.]HPZ29433.1 hypothetical protein [Defluviitoga sp.]